MWFLLPSVRAVKSSHMSLNKIHEQLFFLHPENLFKNFSLEMCFKVKQKGLDLAYLASNLLQYLAFSFL